MDVLPLTCDSCRKEMGTLIFPDHGEAMKIILEAMTVTTQCSLCDITRKKRVELEKKYEAIERHERATAKEEIK